ncbi:MAG: preprotein translocase subunit SecE [Bacilli bacterium]|nr:preprotein translocase subunit SecE [Bacilli bacterium]
MAEVRKKVVEDKYDTSKINKTEVKKEKKTVSNKKQDKKDNLNKKNIFERFFIFCNGVGSEFKKVHWTSKNNMVKYSVSSIFFILFCSGFFYLINVIFALVQSLFS